MLPPCYDVATVLLIGTVINGLAFDAVRPQKLTCTLSTFGTRAQTIVNYHIISNRRFTALMLFEHLSFLNPQVTPSLRVFRGCRITS